MSEIHDSRMGEELRLTAPVDATFLGLSARLWSTCIGLFAAGAIISGGYLAPVGDLAFAAFKQIARAQYEIHLASQNLNADGQAEYAVLMKGAQAEQALSAFLVEKGWEARASSIPGWTVIAAPANISGVVPMLREQSFSKAVLRNRGLWICH